MHSTSASVICSGDLPMNNGTTGAIEDRAQVVERAAEIEVRDVSVPVLVWTQRLNEPSALLGRLLVPPVQQAGTGKHPVHARRTGSDDVLVDHHERQPTIALERKPLVEADDLALLLVE